MVALAINLTGSSPVISPEEAGRILVFKKHDSSTVIPVVFEVIKIQEICYFTQTGSA